MAPRLNRRQVSLLAVLVPMGAMFAYVGLSSGPLAPIAVTTTLVESRAVAPALFGIGTVEARETYTLGPIGAGRVLRLEVEVGDRVKAGQVLGEMDPVDLDDRLRSQESALRRTTAVLQEATARHALAESQAERYQELLRTQSVSDEVATTKRQELRIAEAALAAAGEDGARARSDLAALQAQRVNLRLVSPVDGIVASRATDPGATLLPGQTALTVIDPRTIWIHVRFDQGSATGLRAGLPAQVVLRSRHGQTLKARVLRAEPLADAVTEEIMAKVVFDSVPEPAPPIGELAEVTIALPSMPAGPSVPNAALRSQGGRTGVLRVEDRKLVFVPTTTGASDLDGNVQLPEGAKVGDRVVVYSEKAVTARSRFRIVARIPSGAR
jgi:RND family efflux transporter MFP subunit